MKFTKSLIKGKLIRRYKRFFVDVKINKKIVTAHCPNTGSMKGLIKEGNEVYLHKNDDPKRKLKYGLEIIKANKKLVGVNTHLANKIVNHGLENNLISELKNSDTIKSEVFFDKETRFDFLLEKNNQKIFVEVKNVTLFRDKETAEFPDAITDRGSKHLIELSKLPSKNTRAVMLFLIQRDDCKKFQIASDIDQIYYDNFKTVIKKGVEIICYNCSFESEQIRVNKKIKLINE